MRWWAHANYSSGDQATGEAAVPRRRTDVFGVARPELPADAAKHLSQLQWLGLKPGSDERVASVAGVEAVVCSGQGPHEVQASGRRRGANRRQTAKLRRRFKPLATAWVLLRPCSTHNLARCSLPALQAVKDCAAASKGVFVESLVRC